MGLGQKPVTAHYDDPLSPKAFVQLRHLIGYGGGVPRMARIDVHRNGAARMIRQGSVGSNWFDFLRIPIIVELHRGEGAPFIIAAADIIEHLTPGARWG